eukprot:CAMPEP_0177654622 /NCGR_PEP_ID=MMETSP0447-20121125/14445_1 /TAXON_ID=0 /ORGANISM="Stygamoeba regulata, Strain BSH-02190019" /LENGTH=520 /DNA_ID=CAMNT_0019158313 /DNA_START=139 /DNA_END=1701 /DNA_ORIENTATION=+
MSLSSGQLNGYILRYLHESGFDHSAFVFSMESNTSVTDTQGTQKKKEESEPGYLIKLAQRGLQYREIERELCALSPKELAELAQCSGSMLSEASADAAASTASTERSKRHKTESANGKSKKARRSSGKVSSSSSSSSSSSASASSSSAATSGSSKKGARGLPVAKDAVQVLRGHESEVYICAWNPQQQLLASGSGDSTARLWTVPAVGGGARGESSRMTVLKHFSLKPDQSREVTTLDWNQAGTRLATGSYDGLARVWDQAGALQKTLQRHQKPIFSLKWNRRGDHLLSGSMDNTAVVWDGESGAVVQQYSLHTHPVLDVDWRDNTVFATCSTDKLIHVCEVGKERPLATLKGHRDEVNAIKWDPSGRLLASCSDDHTAKLWSLEQSAPLHDFAKHKLPIYTLRWSPCGPGSANPSLPLRLASASFDTDVRLWDIESGQCVSVLGAHTKPVYSVAYSPNARFLASGSFDKCVHVWDTQSGELVRSYEGDGGIFEICWNRTGDQLAACFASHVVTILDMKM